MLYYIFRYLLWPVFAIIFKPKVYNRENYKVKGKAIYVANHISLLDPVAIAFTCPRIVHFMAKKEIFV
ncbi:MAG: 1-acyl-sn-glycerol-3-phosphate acyltransferase, partial [Clostridia bacterium]|nr:1-acyl-sn-glycerol-3-phosphate acyltransferase [Clostridia bacterium]